MIPLFIFLLGGVAVYLGAIEAAFSALMRLSAMAPPQSPMTRVMS